MAHPKFLGTVLLFSLFILSVRSDAAADADADADADPEADPAGCCSRPTSFVKGYIAPY